MPLSRGSGRLRQQGAPRRADGPFRRAFGERCAAAGAALLRREHGPTAGRDDLERNAPQPRNSCARTAVCGFPLLSPDGRQNERMHEQWHPFFLCLLFRPGRQGRGMRGGCLVRSCASLSRRVVPFFCLVRLRGADCCCRTGRRPAGRRRCGHGTMTRHGRWDMPYSSRRS